MKIFRLIVFFVFMPVLFFTSDGICNSASRKNIIKFNPIELLNNFRYDSGTFQLSYERTLPGKFSINQDFGYIFHRNSKPSIIIIELDDLKGFSLESELRRYFSSHNDQAGKYFCIGFMYKYLDAKDSHTVLDSVDSELSWVSYHSTENYSIFRNEYAVHLKIGYQHITQSGFTHDYSLGLGWRYIASRNTSKHAIGGVSYEAPYSKPFSSGDKSFFSITFAIRFGWGI